MCCGANLHVLKVGARESIVRQILEAVVDGRRRRAENHPTTRLYRPCADRLQRLTAWTYCGQIKETVVVAAAPICSLQ